MVLFWLRLKAFWALRKQAVRIGKLFLDQRVPLSLKMMTGIGALLVISPVDLLGDIPVVGAVDDTLLLLGLAWLFVRLCPPAVVAEYASAAAASRLRNVSPR